SGATDAGDSGATGGTAGSTISDAGDAGGAGGATGDGGDPDTGTFASNIRLPDLAFNQGVDIPIESKIRQTDVACKGAGIRVAAVTRRATRAAGVAGVADRAARRASGCPAVASIRRAT